jgi:hypothetical protein
VLVAELPAPARHDLGRAAEVRRRRRGHAEDLLDALEERRHVIGREVDEAEVVAPLAQHAIGGAVARARVDGGGAADGAADGDVDRRVADRARLEEVAVQLRVHVGAAAVEVAAVEVFALLEHDDGEPGLGELLRHDRAARAGADDDDVALDLLGGRHVRAARHALGPPARHLDRARRLDAVDAAELAEERRVVEVRHLEREEQALQRRAAEVPSRAPGLEVVAPPILGQPGEARQPARVRLAVERAEERARRRDRRAADLREVLLGAAHAAIARAGEAPARGHDRGRDGEERLSFSRGEYRPDLVVHEVILRRLVGPFNQSHQGADSPRHPGYLVGWPRPARPRPGP